MFEAAQNLVKKQDKMAIAVTEISSEMPSVKVDSSTIAKKDKTMNYEDRMERLKERVDKFGLDEIGNRFSYGICPSYCPNI